MSDIEPSYEYYVLGYWCNAYRSNDREYFWMGFWGDRKSANKALKRKLESGQPKTFIDWCGGGGKVYQGATALMDACEKVGINPAVENCEFRG